MSNDAALFNQPFFITVAELNAYLQRKAIALVWLYHFWHNSVGAVRQALTAASQHRAVIGVQRAPNLCVKVESVHALWNEDVQRRANVKPKLVFHGNGQRVFVKLHAIQTHEIRHVRNHYGTIFIFSSAPKTRV